MKIKTSVLLALKFVVDLLTEVVDFVWPWFWRGFGLMSGILLAIGVVL